MKKINMKKINMKNNTRKNIIYNYKICNWTFQRRIYGFPKELLKSAGFIKISKLLLGSMYYILFISYYYFFFSIGKFIKERNEHINIKINLNEFIKQYSNLNYELKNPIIIALLSNCIDNSILLKIIGVKNKLKVYYSFKIVQEMLGKLLDPKTKIPIKYNLSYTTINTTNIVCIIKFFFL